ncbi:hypothetical protein DES53_106346 [Roseimicrobium gellanilyticum]|uniref:Zinc ribbon protein n=1 Tax=Roseimicrobium gellanilyticum TaxID=748857 RepID=A0A366HIP4_9BACT|nr:zinc ribbon domain-containing protein [Roseimicrobium gellanilyticum]RBP42637.1 hypothetical protein DES53_106346 [Roseimicrobium gellanilyticum]
MAYLNSKPRTPEVCPVCGEDVPPKSLACPECGSDHNTGWKKDAYTYDGVDLPDDDEFNYDEFVEQEFGKGSASPKPAGIKTLWWVTAIVLLLAWILSLVY